ncbi:basic blue protein-like [Macadamia integrifolia]|uniref:basic blue protein-like n=1 Tax=Macadamia integrifolia TaxID=60698 RepID=UPI001C4F434C|nr:basic blue protein-like [Macadamia integrifolia]
MAQGRGSAARIVIVGITLLAMLLHCEVVHAAIYTVGDTGGWDENVESWPKGKVLKAGDTLVFKYDAGIHDVVVVDSNGYKNCDKPTGAKKYASGNDQITLAKGMNYFICDSPSHCESGMKIAVNAL